MTVSSSLNLGEREQLESEEEQVDKEVFLQEAGFAPQGVAPLNLLIACLTSHCELHSTDPTLIKS